MNKASKSFGEQKHDIFYYEEGIKINLTDVFGEGKEPSSETVKTLLTEYSIVDIKAGKTPFLAQAA